jgi:hypothetical protein
MREGETGGFCFGCGQQLNEDGKNWAEQDQDSSEAAAPQPEGSHTLTETPLGARRLHGTPDLVGLRGEG